MAFSASWCYYGKWLLKLALCVEMKRLPATVFDCGPGYCVRVVRDSSSQEADALCGKEDRYTVVDGREVCDGVTRRHTIVGHG